MTADLYQVELDPASMPVSRPQQITTQYDNWGAAWSPDGQWLAYFSARGNRYVLVLHPATGGDDRVVTPTGFPQDNMPRARPVWATDGKSLIVRGLYSSQLHSVDVQTGAVRPLINLEQPPLNGNPYHGRVRLSGDGKSVYYVSDSAVQSRKLIVRQNLDGGLAEVLFRSPGTFLSGPSLSPDGTMIAFAASVGSFPDDDVSMVMVMPVTGGQRREVCRVNDHVQDPIWTKDGQRLIFTTYNNPPRKDGKVDVWTVPAAGGQPKSLNMGLHWTFFPDLSPDGKRLVVRDENFNNELWVIKGLFAK
jgi:Tol biopolymer transport system component